MRKTAEVKKQNNINVVLEGEFDFEIINEIIKSNPKTKLNYFVGSGYSSALSIARSLFLKDPKSRLVLILDADSIEEEEINSKRNFVYSYLENQLGKAENFKLILFVPDIATVFFDSKELIEDVIKGEVSELDFQIGKLRPFYFLKEKVNLKKKEEILMPSVVSKIKNHPNFKEIEEFIEG